MSAEPARRRVLDASMELLNSIQRETIEPEYAQFAANGTSRRGRIGWLVVLVGLLAGLMFTTSALNAGRGTPAAVTERNELLAQIAAAEQRNAELHDQAMEMETQIQRLEEQLDSGIDQDEQAAIWSGQIAVSGPGVLLVIHDNPQDTGGVLVDQDLRQVINGLWLAGAEAIAINGYRLSARTAIRQAGSAITVDYRSMTTPYQIEAIGPPGGLLDGFQRNSGGAWLNFLRRNHGVSWSITQSAKLELGADTGLGVDRARIR